MSYSSAIEPGLQIELSIDQQRALETAVARLHAEFAGSFDVAIIAWLLHSFYDQFADGATVHDFLALLAERFTRQRLLALKSTQPNTRSALGKDGAGDYFGAPESLTMTRANRVDRVPAGTARDIPNEVSHGR